MAAQNVVKLGISQVPEGRRIFANMTVMENLELGAFIRSDKAGIAQDLDMVFGRFPRLAERRSQLAPGNLVRRGTADAGHEPGADEPSKDDAG